MNAGPFLLGATSEPVVHLTPQARIIAAILALVFVGFILNLIRRDRLLERYSIIWFLLGLVMLVGAAFPGLLELLARAMGVRDVTIALFSVVLLILLALALNFSVIASRQSRQITRLAQQAAIDSVDPPGPRADTPPGTSVGQTSGSRGGPGNPTPPQGGHP
ncbi:MAG: DUF2304 domain-containing protein [Solirubrobacterales bacterium]|nr:DUF2304 domain-containing protein [Solirubrobacterales bacterium]